MAFHPYALNDFGKPNLDACIESFSMYCALAWNDRARANQILENCGGGDILYFNFHEDGLIPSVMVYGQGNQIYITVVGTSNVQQLNRDLAGIQTRPFNDNAQVNGYFNLVANEIMERLEAVLPLRRFQYHYNFSGHSLGAAASFIMACRFCERYGNRYVSYLGFGVPKSFQFGSIFTKPQPSIMIQSKDDGVTFLPPYLEYYLLRIYPLTLLSEAPLIFWHYGDFFELSDDSPLIGKVDTFYNGLMTTTRISGIASHHPSADYARRLQRNWTQSINQGQNLTTSAILSEIVAMESPIIANNNLNTVTTSDWTEFNGLFGQAIDPPLGPQNVNDIVSVSGSAEVVNSGLPVSIDVSRSIFTMAVDIYKIRLLINCGKYGRSESHCVRSADLGGVPITTLATQLVTARANLLGSNTNTSIPDSALGSPAIVGYTISSATDPHVSQSYEVQGANGVGYHLTAGNAPSDNWASALSVRMQGVSGTGKVSSSLLQVQGQPDDCIKGMRFVGNAVSYVGNTWGQHFQNYLDFLLAKKFGFMGQSASEVKKQIATFAVNDIWSMTFAAAHGYTTGDTIRLSGVNVPGFNGTYKVNVISNTVLSLSKGPPASLPIPTQGKSQRIQLANGSKIQDFYLFNGVNGGVKVSSKRPGRNFAQASFKRRTRRLH